MGPLRADGTVDMTPQQGTYAFCTWAECPGIRASVPIIEGEHGYYHAICEVANQAPFVLADERKRQAQTPPRGYHLSDCAVHNEPAMPAGPCDCADREAVR